MNKYYSIAFVTMLILALLGACSTPATENNIPSEPTATANTAILPEPTAALSVPETVENSPQDVEIDVNTTSDTAEFEGLLPIGSVVVLKGGSKGVMIIGVCQMQAGQDGDILWDYSAALYPEGYLGSDQTYLFNGEQIEQVLFLGHQDSEQAEFKVMADEFLVDSKGSTHVLAIENSVMYAPTNNISGGFEGLLPVGSVVLLENSTKRVMLMGVCQMQPTAEGDVLWDYVGCLYPEGNMGVDQTYLFNGSQIEQVFSLGFQDEEGRAFKAEADEVLKRLRGE